jgi:hypothetical protein
MEMSLTKFIGHVGLWLPGESAGDKLKQIKALTDEDKRWFADRAKIEFGISIVANPAVNPS